MSHVSLFQYTISMSFLSERNSTFQQVKDFHLNSDVDQNAISQHHTLGPLANQASPGDHIHDGKTSARLKLSDITWDNESITFPVLGGTDGTQPTFSSAPLFTGSYTKIGNMCFFQIDVEFDNITSFGTGQYYVKLPFVSSHNYLLSDGCLHDFSTGDEYAILGHVVAGSDTLTLLSTASNGRQVPFEHNVPVTLATTDNFHIAGTYEIQQ
jgi:hypothetical protein